MLASTSHLAASDDESRGESAHGWPILGHDWAVGFLRSISTPDAAGQRERLRHAYLWLGDSALGKSTLARYFANVLLCPTVPDRACGTCSYCQAFQHQNHPDFLLVEPVDGQGQPDRHTGLLRVEQAESILHHVHLRPFQSTYRIILIRDMHLAHPAFMNKLLKTFEEPPATVILLATATEASRLLPTIVSRCQVLRLHRGRRTQIQEALTRDFGVEASRADLLARLAAGRMGWAITNCQQNTLWAERRTTCQLLTSLVQGSVLVRLAHADELARSQTTSRHVIQSNIEFWLSWWHDVWLLQYNQQDACINIDCKEDLEAAARATEPEAVARFLYRLERAYHYVHSNVNMRLVLTNLMLHMPSLSVQV